MNRLETLIGGALLAASPVLAAEQSEMPPMPQPTVEHEQMAREAGTWDAKVTMWYEPGAEADLSTGVETNTMLGSLWLLSKFEGQMAGAPFVGHSQTGYDPTQEKYVGTWIDSISPYMTSMLGVYDVKTHTLTMNTECRCFMTGEMRTGRLVTKYVDNNTKVMEMYGPDDSGNEYLMMRIDYKRQK